MPLHHAAIPTVYEGVQMRSRLEARWAAFFDLCGWQWSYEPLDLDGWIPDFLVEGPSGLPWLCEVKPLKSVSQRECRKISHELAIAHTHGILRQYGFRDFQPNAPKDVRLQIENALMCPLRRNEQAGSRSAFPCWDEWWSDLKYNIILLGLDPTFAIGNCHGGALFCSIPQELVAPWSNQQGMYDCNEMLNKWNKAGNAVQWKSPRRRA